MPAQVAHLVPAAQFNRWRFVCLHVVTWLEFIIPCTATGLLGYDDSLPPPPLYYSLPRADRGWHRVTFVLLSIIRFLILWCVCTLYKTGGQVVTFKVNELTLR